jgi:hypothetical protein
MATKRFPSLLLAALLLLTTFGVAGARPERVSAATEVELCGTVTAYVKPTALLVGAITIGVIPFVIAAGTSIDSDVAVGANLCLRLTLGGAGQIVDLEVVANATVTVEICGTIQAYVKATASEKGSIKLLGRTFKIAEGVSLPAGLAVGEYHCLRLKLNAFGQIKDGDIVAGAKVTVKICGAVTAYAKATLSSTGVLKIAGRTFELALGSDLPAAVAVGADLCLQLTLNAFAQVEDGSVKAGAGASVKICGEVTAYVKATLTDYGQLKIAGHTFVMALGSSLPASVKAGADLCLVLSINAFAQVSDGTAQANVTATLDVCGTVEVYTAATADADGRLKIGAVNKVIAAGTNAAASVKAGAHLKLRLEIDAFARISKVTVLKVGVSLNDACGSGTPNPTPAPTNGPNPTSTPAPTGSAAPTQSANPSASPSASTSPSASPSGSASPAPTGSQLPSESTNPSPSLPPCGEVGGVEGSNGGGGTEDSARTTSAEFVLPDTDSIVKAASVFAVTAFPMALLMALGFVAGVLAWRRRIREQILAEAAQAVPVEDAAIEGTPS